MRYQLRAGRNITTKKEYFESGPCQNTRSNKSIKRHIPFQDLTNNRGSTFLRKKKHPVPLGTFHRTHNTPPGKENSDLVPFKGQIKRQSKRRSNFEPKEQIKVAKFKPLDKETKEHVDNHCTAGSHPPSPSPLPLQEQQQNEIQTVQKVQLQEEETPENGEPQCTLDPPLHSPKSPLQEQHRNEIHAEQNFQPQEEELDNTNKEINAEQKVQPQEEETTENRDTQCTIDPSPHSPSHSSLQEYHTETIETNQDIPRQLKRTPPRIFDIDRISPEPEYSRFVSEYLFSLQNDKGVLPMNDYMKCQTHITVDNRATFVDWLVEVSHNIQTSESTLFLAINLLDRFLSKKIIQKETLLLSGLATYLIAAKFEEISPPRIQDLLQITTFSSRREIIHFENIILSTLDFRIAVPTIKVFLDRFLEAANATPRVRYMAGYLSELTLLDTAFHKYTPSLVAAAVVYNARLSCHHSPWDPTLTHYTKVSLENPSFCECLKKIQAFAFIYPWGRLMSIQKKYSQARNFHSIVLGESVSSNQ